MQLKKLLSKGYFPKELPPPYNSESFGEKSRYINKKWTDLLNTQKTRRPAESGNDAKKRFRRDYLEKYGSSKLIEFSIAKGVFSRRKLEIPNPKQYLDLSNPIVNEWKTIRDYFNISDYSQK